MRTQLFGARGVPIRGRLHSDPCHTYGNGAGLECVNNMHHDA